MRILHTSDWHLDAVTAGIRRIVDLERNVRRTLEIARDRHVDAYVFHGDLADPDSGSILVHVLSIAVTAALDLAAEGIPSFWISGNHDVIEDGSGFSTLHPLKYLHAKVTVFEHPMMFPFHDCEIIFLPFPARTHLYDPTEFMQFNGFSAPTKHRLVFGHCTGLDGVDLGSETRDMARGAELAFPIEECRKQNVTLMCNGHYHKQQRTKDGVWIPGTLERLRFDEEGNAPGVLISEF